MVLPWQTQEVKTDAAGQRCGRVGGRTLRAGTSGNPNAYNIAMLEREAKAGSLTGSKQVHAVCTHDCPDSCGVLVTVDTATGRATRMQGDPAHTVTRGFL